MKLKQIGALVSSLALLGGLLTVPAAAASVEDGVYTASMVTSYYNPDTGNVDDGGTANAALGEGMCRSATDETCLVEVDGDDVWITVRLLLQSNCSDVALYTRSGYDSYAQASYDIMSEDAGNDSIDYRIKVSDVDQKLKCTMYVSPMGRDVLWYLYVDPSTLTEGSGDFVVSIDPSSNAEPTAPAAEEPTVSTQPPAVSTAPADSPTPTTEPTETPDASSSPEPAETPEDTQAPDGSAAPAETEGPAETPEETEVIAGLQTPEDPVSASADPDSSSAEGADAGGSTVQIVIGIVVVAAVLCVIYFVKRKAKKS